MGLILPQEVEITVTSATIKHFENLGYEIPWHIGFKNKRVYSMGSKFKVSVLDLPSKSNVLVDVVCDYCCEQVKITWKRISKVYCHDYNNKINCPKCKGKRLSELQRNNVNSETTIDPLYWNADWLKNEYIEKNRSATSIATECKTSVRRIEKYIKRYNLDMKTIDPHIKLPKEKLYDLYITQKKTPDEICDLYHVNRMTTFMDLLSEYAIPIRTHSESMAIYYDEKNGREIKSEYWKARWKEEDFYNKQMEYKNSIHLDFEKRKRFSCAIRGITEEEWDGFLTPEHTRIRNRVSYVDWRNSVFKRDNYTCQCCGVRNGNGISVYLNAHHKENFADNPSLRFDVENGITLCSKCHDVREHGSFHNVYGTLHNNTEQLIEYMDLKIQNVI